METPLPLPNTTKRPSSRSLPQKIKTIIHEFVSDPHYTFPRLPNCNFAPRIDINRESVTLNALGARHYCFDLAGQFGDVVKQKMEKLLQGIAGKSGDCAKLIELEEGLTIRQDMAQADPVSESDAHYV